MPMDLNTLFRQPSQGADPRTQPQMNGPGMPGPGGQNQQQPQPIPGTDMGFQRGADNSQQLQQINNPANGANGGTGQNPVNPNASPMDQYTDWFTMKTDPNAQVQPGIGDPLFSADNTKLQEIVSKQDFVGNLDPQIVQKVLSGDSAALGQLLNSVGQKVYAQAAQLAHRLVENGVSTYNGRLQTELPKTLQSYSAGQAVSNLNPAFDHPAMKPMVDALKAQYLRSNPNANPTQVAEAVNQYLMTVSSQIKDPKAQANGPRDPMTGQPMNGSQPGDIDWGAHFFGGRG